MHFWGLLIVHSLDRSLFHCLVRRSFASIASVSAWRWILARRG